ncbi:MAG: class I SAM-dependent methyltransferase, partial [Steroidobacteraceae bacterium]
MPAKPAPPEPFGEAFFRRFYLNPKTRVVTQKEMIRRANLIAAFVQHGELEVRSILDVGCGLGLMRNQLLRHFPKAKYTGLEVSQYLCDQHGWTQGSAHTFESPRPFDLVVCYDVFQYLPVRPAA